MFKSSPVPLKETSGLENMCAAEPMADGLSSSELIDTLGVKWYFCLTIWSLRRIGVQRQARMDPTVSRWVLWNFYVNEAENREKRDRKRERGRAHGKKAWPVHTILSVLWSMPRARHALWAPSRNGFTSTTHILLALHSASTNHTQPPIARGNHTHHKQMSL